MTDRPNFLFIITDQQRADWLGCAGHPVLRTPNIDRIAARGLRFEGMHVASPVCMPNRASLMTGRMPSVHGLRYNGCSLSYAANTFVDVLTAAGYHTAALGKSHLQPFLDKPPLRDAPPEGRLIDEAWKDRGADYAQEEPGRYAADGRYDLPLPYYGFQEVDMVTQHGDRCGGHYHQWFRENAPDWAALHDPANELPHSYTCPQAYRTPIPEDLYPTTYIADSACRYLERRSGDDTPFFAFVSFPDPHHPFNPPGRYWDLYDPEQFTLDLPYAAHQNPPPPLAFMRKHWEAGGKAVTAATAVYADDRQLREAMALTAGMIAMVDDAVGRILDALDASGKADNTIVVFTSDHGEYLGDFNLLFKGIVPLRSINRVPFLWADPVGQAGAVTDTLASSIDVAATILDRAGLVPFNGMQGQSFLPTVQTGADHRDAVMIEFNDLGPRLGFDQAARVRSLITKDRRYSHYRDQDFGELYDLAADPHETRNLWDDPAYAQDRCALADCLIHHLTAQMDESPLANRLS